MTAHRPEDVIRLWSERFNAGDLDGLRELYDDAAVLADGAGGQVAGTDAILESWRAFLGSTMVVDASASLVTADLALTHNRGTFTLPDGTAMPVATSEVLRRQPDGGWRYLLCNPYGDGIVPPSAPTG